MSMIDKNLDLMAKLMTTSTRRHAVHAANVANINTPNYRAKEMRFESAFQEALEQGGADAAMQVRGEIVESDARVKSDGNSVHLEREYGIMQKNQMLFNIYAKMLKHEIQGIKHAIDGTR